MDLNSLLEKPPIPDKEQTFNVEVKFTSHYAISHEGEFGLVFRFNVICGDKNFEHEYFTPAKNEFITYEGHRRHHVFSKAEEKLINALWELIPEASEKFFKNVFGKSGTKVITGEIDKKKFKKSDVTLYDKIHYRKKYKELYDGENGWKNAYKRFKGKKSLTTEQKIEELKIEFPNLPPHLIKKFADPDSYIRSPSKIARIHAAEELGLPAQSEEYRRKITEGSQIIESLEFFRDALSQTLSDDNAITIQDATAIAIEHLKNKSKKYKGKTKKKE